MKSVFISHSNKEPDLTVTRELYKFLTEHKIDCWVDILLKAGEWRSQIGEVMYDATVCIFVASKNSMISKEVAGEIGYMHDKGKTIVPLVLDKEYYCNPGREAASAIYTFGANQWQAVFLEDQPDQTAAFERLISLLPADIARSENNPADFVYGESDKILTAYNGHDACVTIPPYVEEIAREAFRNNAELTKVIIPPSVKKIGIRAFFGCSNLVAVNGLEGLEQIEATAFDCSGIAPNEENNFTFADIVFGGGESANEIIIPEGVKIIADEAFRYGGAKTVKFPQGLKTIGSLAFSENIFLESVVIPASVTYIGKNAFHGCRRLKSVLFEGTVPEGADSAFDNLKNLLHPEEK